MDSHDGSRKEGDEHVEEAPMDRSEKKKKAKPTEGSHSEFNVGDGIGEPPVAAKKVLREYNADH